MNIAKFLWPKKEFKAKDSMIRKLAKKNHLPVEAFVRYIHALEACDFYRKYNNHYGPITYSYLSFLTETAAANLDFFPSGEIKEKPKPTTTEIAKLVAREKGIPEKAFVNLVNWWVEEDLFVRYAHHYGSLTHDYLSNFADASKDFVYFTPSGGFYKKI